MDADYSGCLSFEALTIIVLVHLGEKDITPTSFFNNKRYKKDRKICSYLLDI
jgi:hypothetical protein